MLLETIFIVFLVLVGALIIYRGAIHEFQILQKDYETGVDWPTLLTEQLPLVIRKIPSSWLGGWSIAKTGNRTWPVLTKDDQDKKFKIPWNAYLMTDMKGPAHHDLSEFAGPIKLATTFQNWVYDGMSCMHWLPVQTPHPILLLQEQPLKKMIAEWTAIVSTDGAPVELWVAHEGSIPDHDEEEVFPWTATTSTVPWIGDVKYIEIKLRPGNAILIPKHWWVSMRPAIQPDTKRDGAWMWKGEFHSPASQFISFLSSS